MSYQTRVFYLLILASFAAQGNGLQITYPNETTQSIDISIPLHIRWTVNGTDPPFVNIGLQFQLWIANATYDEGLQVPSNYVPTQDQHFMVTWPYDVDLIEGMVCAVVIFTGRPFRDALLAHTDYYLVLADGDPNLDPQSNTSASTMSSQQEETMTATVPYGSLMTTSGPYIVASASMKTVSFDVPGEGGIITTSSRYNSNADDSSFSTVTCACLTNTATVTKTSSWLTYDDSQITQEAQTQTDVNLTSISEWLLSRSNPYSSIPSPKPLSMTPMETGTSEASSKITPSESTKSETSTAETNSAAPSTTAIPPRVTTTSEATKAKGPSGTSVIYVYGMLVAATIVILVSVNY